MNLDDKGGLDTVDLDVDSGADPIPVRPRRAPHRSPDIRHRATVHAFAPVRRPMQLGRFVRRCWHLIGDDRHPIAVELRARSAAPHAGPGGTVVLLGQKFGWEDNARLLDGIAAGRRDGNRVVLVNLGAGGASLLRVAALENPRLETMSIELSACPSARARRVAVAVANGVGSGDVHVDDDGVITQTRWQQTTLPEISRPTPGSVLITGGVGGLGLRAAMVLAHVHGLHPVLLDNASPGARCRQRLHATFLDVDITDRSRTAAALAKVDAPPVRTVVHCAGVLHAGPLDGFSCYDLIRAQQVKVDGLHNVLAALDPTGIRHLITFGSVTAEEPHRNMGCYALANELLRRETLRMAQDLPRCATIAAQWSLWSGAGMAHHAGAVAQARRMGLTPVSLRGGMIALLRLLCWPPGPTAATSLLLRG